MAEEKKVDCCHNLLRNNSLSTGSSLLKTFIASRRIPGVCSISMFILEMLHSLHYGMSKSVKPCTVSYLSSRRLRTEGSRAEERRMLKYEREYAGGAICCSPLSKVMEFPETLINVSKGGVPSSCDGISTRTGLRRMLKSEN